LNNKTNILIDKRLAELKCLGIEPVIYYNACKLIDRHVYVVVKEDVFHIFQSNEFELDSGFGNYIRLTDLRDLIMRCLEIGYPLAESIIIEWKREKTIYYNMSINANKYWEYISLPLYSKETKDEYNF
jgi:hypothetical protein